MMKFACFERTVEALYKYVVPKPRSQCSKPEQLVVTFIAGYIGMNYGLFCWLLLFLETVCHCYEFAETLANELINLTNSCFLLVTVLFQPVTLLKNIGMMRKTQVYYVFLLVQAFF